MKSIRFSPDQIPQKLSLFSSRGRIDEQKIASQATVQEGQVFSFENAGLAQIEGDFAKVPSWDGKEIKIRKSNNQVPLGDLLNESLEDKIVFVAAKLQIGNKRGYGCDQKTGEYAVRSAKKNRQGEQINHERVKPQACFMQGATELPKDNRPVARELDFMDMPHEIQQEVFKCLFVEQLSDLACVSKSFRVQVQALLLSGFRTAIKRLKNNNDPGLEELRRSLIFQGEWEFLETLRTFMKTVFPIIPEMTPIHQLASEIVEIHQAAEACHVALKIYLESFRKIKTGEEKLSELPSCFAKDKRLVIWAIIHNDLAFAFASEELQADKGVARLAVARNGWSLQDASDELRADIFIVALAVMQNSLVLQFASDALKDDEAIVRYAVQQNGLAIAYASERLKGYRPIIELAVKQKGSALGYIHERYQDDWHIVALAVKRDGLALEYASDRLQADEGIVALAIEQEPRAIQFAKL